MLYYRVDNKICSELVKPKVSAKVSKPSGCAGKRACLPIGKEKLIAKGANCFS